MTDPARTIEWVACPMPWQPTPLHEEGVSVEISEAVRVWRAAVIEYLREQWTWANVR